MELWQWIHLLGMSQMSWPILWHHVGCIHLQQQRKTRQTSARAVAFQAEIRNDDLPITITHRHGNNSELWTLRYSMHELPFLCLSKRKCVRNDKKKKSPKGLNKNFVWFQHDNFFNRSLWIPSYLLTLSPAWPPGCRSHSAIRTPHYGASIAHHESVRPSCWYYWFMKRKIQRWGGLS
jgi:hypothetical protein